EQGRTRARLQERQGELSSGARGYVGPEAEGPPTRNVRRRRPACSARRVRQLVRCLRETSSSRRRSSTVSEDIPSALILSSTRSTASSRRRSSTRAQGEPAEGACAVSSSASSRG